MSVLKAFVDFDKLSEADFDKMLGSITTNIIKERKEVFGEVINELLALGFIEILNGHGWKINRKGKAEYKRLIEENERLKKYEERWESEFKLVKVQIDEIPKARREAHIANKIAWAALVTSIVAIIVAVLIAVYK